MKFKFWKNKYKKIRLALHVWATWDFKVTTVTRALANLRLSFYSYVIGQLYNGPACKNHFFSSAAWTLLAFQAHDGNPFCLSRHYSGITAQQGQSHNHHISKKKRKNQAKCSFVAIWDRYSARGHSVRICLVSFSFFFTTAVTHLKRPDKTMQVGRIPTGDSSKNASSRRAFGRAVITSKQISCNILPQDPRSSRLRSVAEVE